ncbi:hypothetical protein [Sporisorium scitamineum]|uniref:Uncharacterized protein n=1 Tax=Sporisorium scitamineum TaxID=49012 RepID=A0A0F7RS48_9BASI|nr:hypothetical protein [Sporisorium scitamineum]
MAGIQVKDEPMPASLASTSTNGHAKRPAKQSLFGDSDSSSDDDDDKPLAKKPKVENSELSSDSDDSDAPLTSTISCR